MASIVIRDASGIARLSALLAGRKLPVTVTIAAGAHRTDAQNRLSHKWYAEAAEQFGDRSTEDVRAECKLRHGVPIMRNDSEAFRAQYDALIRPLPYELKLMAMKAPLDYPVTRVMTVRQISQYLDAVFQFLTEQGVTLTQTGPDYEEWAKAR